MSVARPEVIVEVLDWTRAGADAMPVRETVFVIGQGVPGELERDGRDPLCRQAVARLMGAAASGSPGEGGAARKTPNEPNRPAGAEGAVVGTGRLLPDGHIGRMAVLPPWRGCGIGGAILEALTGEARAIGMSEVVLHAQVHAEDFYRRHGFVAEGEIFMEAGIEHRLMRRRLV